ncbi:IS200/IS605 family transposase [Fluviispira sanaruensis]|uniref:IS200/IS605 family transposase n=1 Tax=Fluviispira sanaruensis TaxID=2493639 RepID=A0A4P2VHX9_FLUSA|nr:IS200/IS605 family transposase [Fluviispira sanaruensis]BBH52643.1 IS200/IS605 family transposase [Fluviispira sanaruensis]
MQDFKKLHHCVYNLKYHLVLVTKYRRKCITDPIIIRLKEIFVELCLKWECNLIEFNGEPDHIHMLLELNPKIALSTFINNLKTVSSRYIRKDFSNHLSKFYYNNPIFWSRSYCILTYGGAPLSVIKQYIEQQARVD